MDGDDNGYPCGCFQDGEGRTCATARGLYEKVIAAYYKAARTNAREDQDEYVRANDEYMAHFRQQMEVA